MENSSPFSHLPSNATSFSIPPDLLEIRREERIDQWELYALKRFAPFFSSPSLPSPFSEPPTAFASSSFSVPTIFNSFILPYVKEEESVSMEEKRKEKGSESSSPPTCTVEVFHSSKLMSQQCIVLPTQGYASASGRRTSAAPSSFVTVTQEPLPLSLPSSGISVKRAGYCGIHLSWNRDGTTTVCHDASFIPLPPFPSSSNAILPSDTRISETEKTFRSATVKGDVLFPSPTTALQGGATKEVSWDQPETNMWEKKYSEKKKVTHNTTIAPKPTAETEEKESIDFPLRIHESDPMYAHCMDSVFAEPVTSEKVSFCYGWENEDDHDM